tara:strand:+ start:102 stop:1226 length:1125 start_codon:yes stop_codon:yes gene_type:complete
MEHTKELEKQLSKHFSITSNALQCLVYMIVAIIFVKTVNLMKAASAVPVNTKSSSIYKRFQRFIRFFKFSFESYFSLVSESFNLHHKSLILCIDRTNWKFGKLHINYLVISLTYGSHSIPLIWSLLTDKKCGNSDFQDRKNIIDKLLEIVPVSRVEVLLADREFLSSEFIEYLNDKGITFVIRSKENLIINNSKGQKSNLKKVFKNLSTNASKSLKGQRLLVTKMVYITAKKLKTGELLILVSNKANTDIDHCNYYLMRWKIELLFSAMKKRGFNLESTHIRDAERLSKLFFIVSIAFILAYKTGELLVKLQPGKRIIKKHGYHQNSIPRIGMDEIFSAVLSVFKSAKRLVALIKLAFNSFLSVNEYDKCIAAL